VAQNSAQKFRMRWEGTEGVRIESISDIFNIYIATEWVQRLLKITLIMS
jgi:hypothetical protein